MQIKMAAFLGQRANFDRKLDRFTLRTWNFGFLIGEEEEGKI